jgi:hypothetical protein
MSGWYRAVQKDLNAIVDCIQYFEEELDKCKKDVIMKGSIEKHTSQLPGIVEHRFNQLQEVEAILEHLNIEMKKLRSDLYKKYLEKYNRALSSRDAEKYIDGEAQVVDLAHLINGFAIVRNRYLGVIKALEAKSYAINNVVKLRCAGLEDAEI